MKKFKMTLRLKVTILSSSILILFCLTMSFFMFQNTKIQIIDPVTSLESEDYYVYSTDIYPTDETVSMLATNVDDYYLYTFLITIIILIVGIIVTYFAVGKSLKPLEKFKNEILSIDEKKLYLRMNNYNSTEELNSLALAFNNMIKKIQEAFTREKSFSLGVAHELKTPLAVIKVNLDVLDIEKKKTNKEYIETFEIVKNQINRMNKLIDDLFSLYELSGYEMLDLSNIKEMIEEITTEFKSRIDDANIKINLNLENCSITCNKVLVKHAISNLMDNAIKYNNEFGNITINLFNTEENCIIEVIDTGIGIPSNDVKQIFEPFYRVDKSRSRKAGGSGLGLSIVKNILYAHNGEIEYIKNNPTGSIFKVKIPKK